jgi:hypothetical protein
MQKTLLPLLWSVVRRASKLLLSLSPPPPRHQLEAMLLE